MARGIALQISTFTPGMRLVAIANRTLQRAKDAAALAGCEDVAVAENQAALDRAVQAGRTVATENPYLVSGADSVDVVVEATGSLEFAARVVADAIERRKHVVLMNAELDATVGPALHRRADRAKVVYTNADGDQPAVIMNLYRFALQIGLEPVLCGNIKGLLDRYRTPATQLGFATKAGQNVRMVTSFADGTKIAFEQAVVANAIGGKLLTTGMLGPTVPTGTPIAKATTAFSAKRLIEGGCFVDYVIGADPAPGIFILATCKDPVQRAYLQQYKLGDGPTYCLQTPFHLCHFEVPISIARAALMGDAAIAPWAGQMVDVVATAKRDLRSGALLDGIGGFDLYGVAEDAETARDGRLLPIGLTEGAVLRRDIRKDERLLFDDVIVPPERLIDVLRKEQAPPIERRDRRSRSSDIDASPMSATDVP